MLGVSSQKMNIKHIEKPAAEECSITPSYRCYVLSNYAIITCRRKDMKEAVHRLRNQLRRKTKKPSTISVLKAAKQEIDVSHHSTTFINFKTINFIYYVLGIALLPDPFPAVHAILHAKISSFSVLHAKAHIVCNMTQKAGRGPVETKLAYCSQQFCLRWGII